MTGPQAALWTIGSGVLGLIVGSFLNVVIHRVPAGESVARPASRCPSCGHEIRPRDNIPVLGWLLLGGRCRDCGTPISPRYPLVELGTGLLFAALALAIAHPALPAYLYAGALGVALALIDVDHHRLPDRLVLPAYPILAALLTLASIISGDWWALARAAIGALVAGAAFLAIVLAYPAGMGFGDVKLSGVLGAALGYLSWGALVIGLFAGFLLGAAIGIALMAAGRATRKSAIPFGPFMLLGALVGLFTGAPLADLYLHALHR